MFQQKSLYVILALTSVIFLDSMCFGLVVPILSPLFMEPKHGMLAPNISESMRLLYFGLTFGVFSLATFLGAPIVGDISDQIGRRKVILFCLLGTVVSSIICAMSIAINLLFVLLIGRALAGVFAGSQPIAQAAIADISHGKDRAKKLGLIGAAGSIGFVLGPIIGGYFSDPAMVSWFNFSVPFYLNALVALLNAALLLLTFKETYTVKKGLHLNFSKGTQMIIQGFTRPSIRKLSVILFLLELTFALYFQSISLFLVQQFHFSTTRVGLFLSLSGLIFAVTLGIFIHYILKFFKGEKSEEKMILLGLGLSMIGYVLPLLSRAEWLQWIALFPIIIGIGVAYNGLLAAFSKNVSAVEQGWVMGITSAVMALSWIFGAIGTSLFFYLDPYLFFVMSALFIFIAIGFAILVNELIVEGET